jgi:hypothetical protein
MYIVNAYIILKNQMYGVLPLGSYMFVPGLCLVQEPAQLLQSLPGQPRQQVLHSIKGTIGTIG